MAFWYLSTFTARKNSLLPVLGSDVPVAETLAFRSWFAPRVASHENTVTALVAPAAMTPKSVESTSTSPEVAVPWWKRAMDAWPADSPMFLTCIRTTCVSSSATITPSELMEPASVRTKDSTMKSGVDRLPLAATKGVMLAVSIKQTNQMGSSALRRIRTPRVGLLEPVDGDRFSLALPLRQKLIEQVIVLAIADAEATAFFPQKQLLCTGQ